jgi:hypothetical protein
VSDGYQVPQVRVWDAEFNVLGDSDRDPYCNSCGLPHAAGERKRGER